MWDFSWLERRWPGAGYENWDEVLNELKVRGYDAVRIDAYPHLVSIGPEREWDILPPWNTQDWGSPAATKVQVQPALNMFIEKCAERGIWVGLSTWIQKDRTHAYSQIESPQDLGRAWVATLDTIKEAGLLGHILYVDIINEWPIRPWTPFLSDEQRKSRPEIKRWEQQSLEVLRADYPDLSYTFSGWPVETVEPGEFDGYDLFDLHIWMAGGEFYRKIGYNYERFDPIGYERVVQHAEKLYREDPDHWRRILLERINRAASQSRTTRLPLMTTESWALVDYKDWPLLSWDWIKELCDYGVREAAATGRWVALATSNFCGPQFQGMWRDVAWHQRLTRVIHDAPVDPDLRISL